MANAKKVVIEGHLPFDIANRSEDVQKWLGMMNTPTSGIKITYGGVHYEANDHGGKTAMYDFIIEGVEAIWNSALGRMVAEFQAAGAVVTEACALDMDNRGSGWESLFGWTAEAEAAQQKAAADYVAELMVGKKWKTTVHANGVESSVLVPIDAE
jgi:hypothetical protein